MSIFQRVKSFVENTEILAEDFEAEFDAIAEAFNGLFKPGRVSASGTLALTTSYQDVPGASLSITPAVPSLLLVLATANLELANPSSAAEALATLNVDGSDRADKMRLTSIISAGLAGGTFTQGYDVSLSAAAHTVKMRAKRVNAESGACQEANTGFLYLLIPEP